MLTLLFWLLVAHAVCDYPLQGDFLARAKNHRLPLPGVPWAHGLAWHALTHGGAVALITGSVSLGLAETAAHAVIDFAKSERWLTPAAPVGRSDDAELAAFHVDQALHCACKVAWVVAVGWWG